MVAAIRDANPVVFIDDRWLYAQSEHVPEQIYEVEIGKGVVRKAGRDVTVVAISHMALEAAKALPELSAAGIDVELIDPRTIKPLDTDLIVESVKKTGRLVVADVGWLTCGVAAEIAALVSERAFHELKSPIQRIALPDCPAPASQSLERSYYNGSSQVVAAVRRAVEDASRGAGVAGAPLAKV
jgi:pyruvate dehydrogenase E1 component beta subunit